MPDPEKQPAEHPQFDLLCAEVEDYERLPASAPAAVNAVDEPAEAIDEEILAGLVSP